MEKEIERKFLIKNLPDLSNIKPIINERYYLFISDLIEVRIDKKDNEFFFERKLKVTELTRENQKFPIKQEEFDHYKKIAIGEILRESYSLNNGVKIKIYKGEYEDLIRAEIEFESEDLAKNYIPEDWMGPEITSLQIGKDSSLMELSHKELKEILSGLMK